MGFFGGVFVFFYCCFIVAFLCLIFNLLFASSVVALVSSFSRIENLLLILSASSCIHRG